MNRNIIASFFRLNPETIFAVPAARELCPGCRDVWVDRGERCDECAQIDKLKAAAGKHRDIAVETNPYRPPSQRFEAYDRVSYDPDPEMRFCIYGLGATKAEAINDLLQELADAELASAADTRHIQTNFSPFEPPEVRSVRESIEDDE